MIMYMAGNVNDIDPLFPAIMEKKIEYNASTRTYILTPLNDQFNAPHPGEFINIRVDCHGTTLERTYSVSGNQGIMKSDNYNTLRITIKKEPNGLFGEWLFVPQSFSIEVTQPKGTFYSVTKKEDFIFVNGFNQIMNLSPPISVEFFDNSVDGFVTKEIILKIIPSFYKPDIFICGPEGFKKFVCGSLDSFGYNKSKIHFEEYVRMQIN